MVGGLKRCGYLDDRGRAEEELMEEELVEEGGKYMADDCGRERLKY